MMRHRWIRWSLVIGGGALGLWVLIGGGRTGDVRGEPSEKTPLVVSRLVDPNRVSDAAVRDALNRGSAFLMAQFKDGEIARGRDVSPAFHQGLNALCVYALLSAGQATRDARYMPTSDPMRRLIENMKLHPMATDRDRPQSPVVYARSLRAAALALYARPDDMDVLRDDVQWLVDASVEGAYSYDDRASYRVIPDESGDHERLGRGPGGSPVDRGPLARGGGGISPASPKSPAKPTSPVAPGEWSKRPTGRPIPVIVHPPIYRPPPPRLSDVKYRFPTPVPRTPPTPGRSVPPTGGGRGGGGVRAITPPALPPPNYPPQELPEKVTPFVWDNSNSQYGFFGVLSGAEAGIEVPDEYFQDVQWHWMTYQLRTGEWAYRLDRPVGYLAMTCAGLASLTAAHDYLQAPTIAKVGQQRGEVDEALGEAFDWLGRGDNAVAVDGPQKVYVGYTLFGLERVGLLSGYKYLGSHEWYPELARKVVLSQSPGGSWGKTDEPTADTLIDTAYSVLFLARGRHPVMMNKLQLDPPGKTDHGEWDNRPRDLANLARFASWELERPVQWQVVALDRDPADWSDAPILSLASHAALKLSDAEVAKIRAFVDAGGVLFTQADDGAGAFNAYVDQLAKRLYPHRSLTDLPRDHEIYTLQYQIPPAQRPRLRGMTDVNGRLVWIHSPTDLAVSWQQRAIKSKREAFELGVNLFAYAVGKSDLRTRLEPRGVAAPPGAATTTRQLTRIRHGGTWDPQPLAFARFARGFEWETSLRLNVSVVDAAALPPSSRDTAYLVLPVGEALSNADTAALRQFVSAGGTLIVESPGATSVAATSAKNTVRGEQLASGLSTVFPHDSFVPVTEDHPLVNASAPGMQKVWPLKVRPFVTKRVGGGEIPPVRVAQIGAGRVIHVPFDLSAGLLGCAEWGVLGYEPATAQALTTNALLWPAGGGQ